MISRVILVGAIISCLCGSQLVAGQSKDVTNSEIRDAILSLVHSYSLLDNKLERHEQRERALGELIKKGLLTLQKNQRMFEPLKGIVTRMDERLGQIETKFIEQEDKITNVLSDILGYMKENVRGGSSDTGEFSDIDTSSLGGKFDEINENIKGLRIQIGELRAERAAAEENSKELVQKAEKLVENRLASADEVIAKLEDKLTHFYIVTNGNGNGNGNGHGKDVEQQIVSALDSISESLKALPDRHYLQELNNETLSAIADTKFEVLTATDKSFAKTGNRVKEVVTALAEQLGEVVKRVDDISVTSDNLLAKFTTETDGLRAELANITNLEKVLIQTGDNVLDVKRRVEYGVHQILLEVNDLIKESTTGLNGSIVKRLDEIDGSIMANISAKIETEISQVWRQIGIMYNEISSSKQALDKLQQQTEIYVNGTITTMDSMEGKVTMITGRMAEVDENLNYLLGRLSLVTQEFGQIKTGLSSALESIRNSFKAVQEQVDAGPGPHNIPEADQ